HGRCPRRREGRRGFRHGRPALGRRPVSPLLFPPGGAIMAPARRVSEDKAPPEMTMSNSASQAEQAYPNTVLIVDDSNMDRHLAGAIVQKMGNWRPAFATNGVEALEAMSTSRPDVVLTDMLMPEMDGLQLVQAIRSKYPLIPVILMTAHGSEDVAIQALQK